MSAAFGAVRLKRDALRLSPPFGALRLSLCLTPCVKDGCPPSNLPFLGLPSAEGLEGRDCPSPSDGHSLASSAPLPIAMTGGHRGVEEEGTASLPPLAREDTGESEEDPQGFAAFIAKKYRLRHDWVVDLLPESPREGTVSR